MLYRNRNIRIEKELCDKYLRDVHAPVETYFCDCAIHRTFGTDVVDDADLENYSDQEIEGAVMQCMKEDILAVSLKKEMGR